MQGLHHQFVGRTTFIASKFDNQATLSDGGMQCSASVLHGRYHKIVLPCNALDSVQSWLVFTLWHLVDRFATEITSKARLVWNAAYIEGVHTYIWCKGRCSWAVLYS